MGIIYGRCFLYGLYWANCNVDPEERFKDREESISRSMQIFAKVCIFFCHLLARRDVCFVSSHLDNFIQLKAAWWIRPSFTLIMSTIKQCAPFRRFFPFSFYARITCSHNNKSNCDGELCCTCETWVTTYRLLCIKFISE